MTRVNLRADVFVWHDRLRYQGHGAESRFYFKKKLERSAFISKVWPRLDIIPGVLPGTGVRMYPYFITVQWSDRLYPDLNIDSTEELVEKIAIEGLSKVFGWDSPQIEHLHGRNEVNSVSSRVGRDWRKGQL